MRAEHKVRLSRIKHDLKELLDVLETQVKEYMAKKPGQVDGHLAILHNNYTRLEVALEILKEL